MNNSFNGDILFSEETSLCYPGCDGESKLSGNTIYLHRSAWLSALAVTLALSTITAINDPWSAEKSHHDNVVSSSAYQKRIGRPVSWAEALRIARQGLEKAEIERLAFAEMEAARGIQWSDEG